MTGALRITTEFGIMDVPPGQVAVVQRGIRFSVALRGGEARGYVLEVTRPRPLYGVPVSACFAKTYNSRSLSEASIGPYRGSKSPSGPLLEVSSSQAPNAYPLHHAPLARIYRSLLSNMLQLIPPKKQSSDHSSHCWLILVGLLVFAEV